MKSHNEDKPAPPALEFERKLQDRINGDTVQRIFYFTLFLSTLFFVYGFTSFSFIQTFDASVTVWNNVWPRFVFNALPLLLLAYYLRRSQQSALIKVYVWIACVCLIFDGAAMVHVWPIAWKKDITIILYVNATNNAIFAAIGMLLALPFKQAVAALSIIAALFWFPLAVVLFHHGDSVTAEAILSDTVFLSASSFVLGLAAAKAHYKLAVLEAEREAEATRFLGPVVSQAIFENRDDILEEKRVRGFVAHIDIRDSTEHQKKYGQVWLDFRKEYFSMVARIVDSHGGYIQKTIGDCHILNFGVMERRVDLSDIPGIEEDEKRAEERRLQETSNRAFACLDEIFSSFERLAHQRFADSVHLGGGIDKGFVERAVHGDSTTVLELDVNGDPVNCSSRLQEYSKALRQEAGYDASILVVSPFASDYLRDLSLYQRKETSRNPIRSYPQIRWVLYRSYANAQVLEETKRAA